MMTDQIKMLVAKSFPPALGITIEYFEGKDEDTGRQYLVFSMTSPAFKNIYRKSRRLSEGEIFFDVEDDFIGILLADFIILGTTFLTQTVMLKMANDRNDADNILKHPFSKGRLNSINRN